MQYSKSLKKAIMLRVGSLTPEEREILARLWEQYVNSLPLPWRNYAIAILGYPRVVRYTEIPNLIRTDPQFAQLLVKIYGR